MTRMTDVVLPPTFEQTASFTPGPWFYRTSGDGFIIRSKTAIGPIAGVNGFRPIGEAEANAHRIVTAVNAFDDMKAALTDALRSTRKDFKAGPDGDRHHREAYAEQFAAISKAEGQSTRNIGQVLSEKGQELAPDPERRVNGSANGGEK